MDIETECGVKPFRWWIQRNRFVSMIAEEIPPRDWHGWEAQYDNDSENNKRTTRDMPSSPLEVDVAVHELRSNDSVRNWSKKLGYFVSDDPTMHGGGFHVTYPNGWLSTHLDYSAHPHLPNKERRLNLIAFLNPEWKSEWGGALQLCDPMGKPIKEIYPEPGMLVAFETDDLSYHGVSRVTGPVPRATVAVYYLSELRPGVTRKRALFIPNRGSM